jgi:hypothetical protein
MPVKLVSGEGRYSFAQVWEPRAMEPRPGEAPKEPSYSFNFMFPKTDVAQYNAVVAALKQEFDESKARKNKNSIPANIQFDDHKKGWWKNPLKDGDAYADESLAKKGVDRPEYRGMWYFQASKKSSDGRPEIAEIRERKLIPLTDKADFYSGCWGRCSVNVASYNHPTGGPGLSLYINSVVKTRDDEAFAATTSKAEVDFADAIDPNDFLN